MCVCVCVCPVCDRKTYHYCSTHGTDCDPSQICVNIKTDTNCYANTDAQSQPQTGG
jgi:hypothetical protein